MGNGCIESYELGNNPLAVSLPDNALACGIEYDRMGQPYFNLYSHFRNGYEKVPETRRVAIVEPIHHTMTEREAGSPEITYSVTFYHGVV